MDSPSTGREGLLTGPGSAGLGLLSEEPGSQAVGAVAVLICSLRQGALQLIKERDRERERERERERKREREKTSTCERNRSVASHTPPIGDLAHNPGVCPDWESNR